MTTTITVKAGCDPDLKKIEVTISNMGQVQQVDYLKDGDERDYTVVDSHEVLIKEIAANGHPKPPDVS